MFLAHLHVFGTLTTVFGTLTHNTLSRILFDCTAAPAPAGMTAIITMFNARTFLEEGRFEPSAAAQVGGWCVCMLACLCVCLCVCPYAYSRVYMCKPVCVPVLVFESMCVCVCVCVRELGILHALRAFEQRA
jgi:hypothetical protein